MARAYTGKSYKQIYRPDHPLASVTGKVLIHRLILFERHPDGASCHWCGRTLHWFSPPFIIGDHEDGDFTNNDPSNIVPSCRGCNGNRVKKPSEHGTIGGYQNLKCRKPCCREAWNADARERRARHKVA